MVYAATPKSTFKKGGAGYVSRQSQPGPTPSAEWELPYAMRMPMGAYALAASRHMHQFGTTSEQLAQIAVDTRKWATLNPRARLQDPITVEDVLASPIQASPLHKLDCCLVTDGAGAVVLTSTERARTLRRAAGARPRHRHLPHPRHDQRDARPRDDRRRRVGSAGVRRRRADPRRHRRRADLRLVHHHRALAARGPGLLPQGRGRIVRRRRRPGARWVRCRRTPPAVGSPTPTPGCSGSSCWSRRSGSCGASAVPGRSSGAEVALAHGSGGVLSAMSTVILGTEATA